MYAYEDRVKSFEYWYGKEDKYRLADVGFYYTGHADRVVCAYCKLELYNFGADTDIVKDHKRFSPHCPFISAQCSGTNFVATNLTKPYTIRSNYNQPLHVNSHVLKLETLEGRFHTYINFPKVLKPLIGKLCQAGLFYTNVGDCVCCYVCGALIKDWDAADEPAQRHASVNGVCAYIRYTEKSNFTPSAPNFADVHRLPPLSRIPKCITCREHDIDCVLLPCYHFCLCTRCGLVCVECPVCRMSNTGVFVVNIPTRELNVIDSENGGAGGV